MRKIALTAVIAASVAASGCATSPGYGYNDPYYNNGYNNNGYYPNGGNRQAQGAVAGAAVGAATGAVAGAVLGGVLGATINGRQYYRDTRGYCYYVDQYGQPHYNYQTRC